MTDGLTRRSLLAGMLAAAASPNVVYGASSMSALKTPSELFSSRLVLPFDKKRVSKVTAPRTLTYVAGGWPGYTDMAATGERDEIGLVTASIGEWLCGGSPNNMLVWAKSHASVPIHFRDKDGQIVSIVKEPRASCYYDPRAVAADPWYEVKGPVKPDTAHYPACNFVPFLATGDRFYLEEIQFAANYHSLVQNPGYRGYSKGLIDTQQTRSYAWALRDIASAYLATPESAPAGLHPKSYWKAILDTNRDNFLAKWVGKNGCHFAVDVAEGRVGPWQQDMLGIVLGWMVYTGRFDDWSQIYEWHIRQAIDRTSGKSGYPRSRAIKYYYEKNAPDMATLALVNGLSETADGSYPTGTDTAYCAYLRMNLKIAVLNGIPDAPGCFAYADSQTPYVEPKWAV